MILWYIKHREYVVKGGSMTTCCVTKAVLYQVTDGEAISNAGMARQDRLGVDSCATAILRPPIAQLRQTAACKITMLLEISTGISTTY